MRRHSDGRGFVHVGENTAKLITGEIDPATWDDEEVLRGKTRAKDGTFRGRPPSVVPMTVYQEFIRRQLQRAEMKFVENVAEATAILAAIAKDKKVEPETRLKAIAMIHDRIWGKPKERVELGGALEVEPEWRRVIEEVTINRDDGWAELDELEAGDVVDAEIVDDDDEWVFGDDDE